MSNLRHVTRSSRLTGSLVVLLSFTTAMACGSGHRSANEEPDGGNPATPDADSAPGDAGDPGEAPPLDPTVASAFGSAFRFIYDGRDATQIDVDPGAIDERRVAIVRGRVLDREAAPLAGVKVTAPGRPELGHALSKADGTFDFALNGGGDVRLAFAKDDYLTAQRELRPGWQSFEHLKDVVLVEKDPAVTEVTLGASALKLATGSKVTDRSGSRTGRLLFREGTKAKMVLPDGEEKSLSSASVRVTEYTVGDNGPKAMPASLPPQSGYTYAVELTIDEADAAGGRVFEAGAVLRGKLPRVSRGRARSCRLLRQGKVWRRSASMGRSSRRSATPTKRATRCGAFRSITFRLGISTGASSAASSIR